jgi:hypothetical protein
VALQHWLSPVLPFLINSLDQATEPAIAGVLALPGGVF